MIEVGTFNLIKGDRSENWACRVCTKAGAIEFRSHKVLRGWYSRAKPACPENDVTHFDLAQRCFLHRWLSAGAMFGEAVVIPNPRLLPIRPLSSATRCSLAKGRLLIWQVFKDHCTIGQDTTSKIRQACKKRTPLYFENPTNRSFA